MSAVDGGDEGEALGTPLTPARKLSARLAKFAYSSTSPVARTRRDASIASAASQDSKPAAAATPSPRKKQRRSAGPDAAVQTPDSVASSPGPSRSRRDGSESSEELHALTPSKKKVKKVPRGYAAPETYDHLLGIPDYLAPGLSVIFCGINPGKMSSIRQHHFAHPSNKFWKALADSGFTDGLRACGVDDAQCVELFGFGLTNLVPRVTSEQAELSTAEMRQCVPLLLSKLDKHRPRVCCFVGKKIWDVFESVIKKSARPAGAVADGAMRTNGKSEPKREVTIEQEDVVEPKQEPADDRLSRTVMFDPIPPPDADEEDVKPIAAATPSPRKFGTSNSVAFGWDQPRAYVLPHQDKEAGDVKPSAPRYTMFWVVPSTSGLERTPYAELVRHFANLGKLADLLEHDDLDWRDFRHIDVEGVQRTVDDLRAKEAEKIAAKQEPVS